VRGRLSKLFLPSCRFLPAVSDYVDRAIATGSTTLHGKGDETTMAASKPIKKLQGKSLARVKPLTEIVISKTVDRSSPS
jgi:hypothetical protein